MADSMSSVITDYQAVLYGEGGGTDVAAYIHCFHDGENVATCIFHNNEGHVPPNEKESDGRVELNYPISRFDSVIDLLRNEEPVFFLFVESSRLGYIATNKEPVGEGDGKLAP